MGPSEWTAAEDTGPSEPRAVRCPVVYFQRSRSAQMLTVLEVPLAGSRSKALVAVGH